MTPMFELVVFHVSIFLLWFVTSKVVPLQYMSPNVVPCQVSFVTALAPSFVHLFLLTGNFVQEVTT